ncbi:SlyX family protein [Xanthomonas hortorum]|uniref:SlyX family protein n=1 Tax=Xanthomonas hortorum TaxID=56454 RepID=UPI002FDFC8C6
MHEQLSPRDQELDARLVELETRLSFQEHALNELSEALADARLTGARNAELIRPLLEDLGKVRSTLFADAADEPPPPHY